VVPLSRAGREHFVYGVDTIQRFAKELTDLSFFHKLDVRSATQVPAFVFVEKTLYAGVLPAVLLVSLALAIMATRKWFRFRGFAALCRNDRALFVIAGTMVLVLAMMLAGHWALGVPYITCRTAIFWAPLLTLAVMLLIAVPRKAIALPALVFGLLAVVMFAFGFTTDHYAEWKYDRSTKSVVRIIQERNAAGREVRLGVNWQYVHTINFYRRRFRLDWLKPVDRRGPDGDFDYYYLGYTDTGLVAKRQLRTLLVDAGANAVLAVKP
jgi:hypothetical protein